MAESSWFLFYCFAFLATVALLQTCGAEPLQAGLQGGAARELKVGDPVSFRLFDGIQLEGYPIQLCNRIQVSGRSRIFHPEKLAHGLRLKIEQQGGAVHPGVQVCLNRNVSEGICECSSDVWVSLHSGKWSALHSPYETLYIDVKAVDSYTDASYLVTATEEFHSLHLIYMITGLACLLLSEMLSTWVPFYYTSAMSLGVLLVVLILLYQGMKLLPTGRKNTLYLVVYGSVVGLGTVVLRSITSALSKALSELGITDDIPITMFLGMLVVIVGAGFGYWGVRKLVLMEDGQVDAGTAHFVKWTMRIVGATLLLQSSRDDVFALVITGLGWLACWAAARVQPREWKLFQLRRLSFSPLDKKERQSFIRKIWTRTSVVKTVTVTSPGGLSKTPGSKSLVSASDDFYSSYHTTSGRKPLTSEELDEISKSCTQEALKKLVASAEFAKWAVTQSDRILVAPTEAREERPEEEIPKTAFMEQVELEAEVTPQKPVRRRFTRYA